MGIQQCREADLELLETHMPSPGWTRRHDQRFERQQQAPAQPDRLGRSHPGRIGRDLVARMPSPRSAPALLPLPRVQRLGSQTRTAVPGIGTAIVHAAETLARRRGYQQIGLGVDDHNHRAAALYLRLGYRETGCHYTDRYH